MGVSIPWAFFNTKNKVEAHETHELHEIGTISNELGLKGSVSKYQPATS
jgi:hypothetical protein